MNYWLIKSEPFKYSFDQLMRDKKTFWDGVRNYQARNFLRAMQVGDLALYYHSNEGKEIVGVAQVIKAAYRDPTATEGDWSVVDVKPIKKITHPVSLEQIKTEPKLAGMLLIKQSRLSVMPVSKQDFELLVKMGA